MPVSNVEAPVHLSSSEESEDELANLVFPNGSFNFLPDPWLSDTPTDEIADTTQTQAAADTALGQAAVANNTDDVAQTPDELTTIAIAAEGALNLYSYVIMELTKRLLNTMEENSRLNQALALLIHRCAAGELTIETHTSTIALLSEQKAKSDEQLAIANQQIDLLILCLSTRAPSTQTTPQAPPRLF